MTDEDRAKQNILKVEIEKCLCEAFTPFFDGNGYDVIASLMCTDTHNTNKIIGKMLRQVEFDYSIDRPEDWNDFSNRISKAIWAEGSEDRKKLSAKTKGLRNAIYSLAVLADCFEYIEKSELKLKEETE